MKRQNKKIKPPTDNVVVNRLGSSIKVSRDFVPWTVKRGTPIAEVEDFIRQGYEFKDADASYLTLMLDKYSVNELIVEGLIRVVD